MLVHPKLVSQDLYHYASSRPLVNLSALLTYIDLDATLATAPVEAGAFGSITVDGVTCLLLQSIEGSNNKVSVIATSAEDEVVSFDFDVLPVLLPPLLGSDGQIELRACTTNFAASIYLSADGIGLGAPGIINLKVQNTGDVATARSRYRIVVDDSSGECKFYVIGTASASLLGTWVTGVVGALDAGGHVLCSGDVTTPVATRVYELRGMLGGNEPEVPIVSVVGATNADIGVLETLDGSGSEDPGGGDLDLLWSLSVPSTSDTAITEETTPEVEAATPGGATITFSLSGLGLLGDRYFLQLANGDTMALEIDGYVISLTYPEGTLFDALRIAIESSSDPAYNPDVAAILSIASSGEDTDLPDAGNWNFKDGVYSSAETLIFAADVKGVYIAYLSARSSTGVWKTAEHPIAAEPVSVVYGSSPDVGFIRNQVANDWWRKIEGHKVFEQAWQGSAQILSSDLLDVLQTRLTRVFNAIPEFWRKRWFGLKMHHEFKTVAEVTTFQNVLYALRGAAAPSDDYDGDGTTHVMVPQNVVLYAPLVVDGAGDVFYLMLPEDMTWEELVYLSPGSRVTVGTNVYRVVSVDGAVAEATPVAGQGQPTQVGAFSVLGVASGAVAGTERDFMVSATTSAVTEIGCPQDGIPSLDLVDAGNDYGYEFDANILRLQHGYFSADTQAGDWLLINGAPRNIVSATVKEVVVEALEDFVPPAIPTGYFTWEIRRPVTSVVWDSAGYAVIENMEDYEFGHGDLLRMHVRGPDDVTEQLYVTLLHVDDANSRYYFSMYDLYYGLSLLRESWGDLDVSCSAVVRGNNIPLPDTTHHVPVIRSTLDVDAPAFCVNEDYQIVDDKVVLDDSYTKSSVPPQSLWAENMLLHNKFAGETFGAMVGVDIEDVKDPAVLVPTIRSVYDQLMYGPWKVLLERSAGAIVGVPFAAAPGTVASLGDDWVGIDGLDGLRMYKTESPPTDLAVNDFISEFQLLDTRVHVVDRVDDSMYFSTYRTLKSDPDWWHDFLVVVQHTAAALAPWRTLQEFVRKAKPIWEECQLVLAIEVEAELDIDDAVVMHAKKYLFDVPTGCVYPDAPLVKGCAHMMDDPVFSAFTPIDFTATGGSNIAVQDSEADFVTAGVKRGCVVLNLTKEAWGWVTRVQTTELETLYGMKDESGDDDVVNEADDEIRLIFGGFRFGITFDTPLRSVAGVATDATTIVFQPADGVNYKNEVVSKDVEFYGIDRGWIVKNRSFPDAVGVVEEVDTDTDQITLAGAGIVGQAATDVIEYYPPTGIGVHVWGDPELRGPQAHPYMKSSTYDGAKYQHDGLVVLYDEDYPIPPGMLDDPIPVGCKLSAESADPGQNVDIYGHYMKGVTGVSVGVTASPAIIVTKDNIVRFQVPVVDPGVYDLSITDPNGTYVMEAVFEVTAP